MREAARESISGPRTSPARTDGSRGRARGPFARLTARPPNRPPKRSHCVADSRIRHAAKHHGARGFPKAGRPPRLARVDEGGDGVDVVVHGGQVAGGAAAVVAVAGDGARLEQIAHLRPGGAGLRCRARGCGGARNGWMGLKPLILWAREESLGGIISRQNLRFRQLPCIRLVVEQAMLLGVGEAKPSTPEFRDMRMV